MEGDVGNLDTTMNEIGRPHLIATRILDEHATCNVNWLFMADCPAKYCRRR